MGKKWYVEQINGPGIQYYILLDHRGEPISRFTDEGEAEHIADMHNRDTAGGWISVGDELPQNLQIVFVARPDEAIRLGYYWTESNVWYIATTDDSFKMGNVTHWMPIPPLSPAHVDAGAVNEEPQYPLPPACKPLEDRIGKLELSLMHTNKCWTDSAFRESDRLTAIEDRLSRIEWIANHLPVESGIEEKLSGLTECASRQAKWLSANDNKIDRIEHRFMNHRHEYMRGAYDNPKRYETTTPVLEEDVKS